MKIAVIGLGNFGTALARVWLDGGHDVRGWTVEQEVNDSILHGEVNKKYLPDVPLPGLEVTMDLAAAVDGAEFVVLALPSSVVLDVVASLAPSLKAGQVLLDLAKGLAEGDRLISDVIETILNKAQRHNPVCVMMGPTIAPELAAGVYTTALVASQNTEVAQRVAAALSTETLTLAATDDPLGAEYWGSFKNVIALACGIADGLKESGKGGDNLKAGIFTMGYAEGARLLPTLGASPDTAFSAAGIGDLFVTAISPHGRNREMGQRLGQGQTLEQAQSEMVMVSEGVRAARMFKALFETRNSAAPFVETVCRLLDGELNIDEFPHAVLSGQPG